MTKKIIFAATALQVMLSSSAFATDAVKQSHGPWEFRLRAIGVLPDSGGHTTIGGTPHADNAFVPEFDISYFFTKNIAAELILATSPHDLTLRKSSGNLDLGSTMILPPTLTAQYHFTPDQKFSPYVGGGVNYTLPYAEDNGRNTNKLKADGSFGWALQAGADYWINKNWGVNIDVKKVYVNVDASINGGAITGNVKLDPWIIGTGVSYRF